VEFLLVVGLKERNLKKNTSNWKSNEQKSRKVLIKKQEITQKLFCAVKP